VSSRNGRLGNARGNTTSILMVSALRHIGCVGPSTAEGKTNVPSPLQEFECYFLCKKCWFWR